MGATATDGPDKAIVQARGSRGHESGPGTRTIECLARPTQSGVHGPKDRRAEMSAGSQNKLWVAAAFVRDRRQLTNSPSRPAQRWLVSLIDFVSPSASP